MYRKRQLKKLTRRIRPVIAGSIFRALGRLPLSANRRLGRMTGSLLRLGGRALRISRDNVQRCFPEMDAGQQTTLARQSLTHTAMTALESLSIWAQPFSKLQHYIVGFDNFDLIDRQRRSGRGLLLLAPHLGNWEIMGPFLARSQQEIIYMYQPSGMPAVDELIIRGRTQEGALLAPTTRRGVSQVLSILRSGSVAVILPDQVPEQGAGRTAQFFEQPAYTMTLVYKLIQRTGCDVLLIYARRVSAGFELVAREPDNAIRDSDMLTSLNALNRSVEACVREIPEQYQWEYKRFRKVE